MEQRHIGRYRVVRLLGSGGMGKVYEAIDDELGRRVALKGLLAHQSTEVGRQRLRREALATARLSHPGIAQVYGLEHADGEDWLAMEMVDGRSLAETLESGPLPPAEVARIGAAVAEALAIAHAHGIVHRDVKAENVMLTPEGHVKVLDFGLIKWQAPDSPQSNSLTAEGLVVGTARAMSPEQALGKPVDTRSDIFSLGSLLWEMAVGSPAFEGSTSMETMLRLSRGERPRLAEVAPGLPADLAALIERCLEVDPNRRFQRASEVASRLASIVPGATRTTACMQPPTRFFLPSRTRRWLLRGGVAVAGAAVALVTALSLGWLGARRLPAVLVLPAAGGPAGAARTLGQEAVTEALVLTLANHPNVSLVEPEELAGVAVDTLRVTELSRLLGATWVAHCSLLPGARPLPDRLQVSLVEGASGRIRASASLDVDGEDVAAGYSQAVTAMRACLQQAGLASPAGSPAPPAHALLPYLRARSSLRAGGSFTLDEEANELEASVAAAPWPPAELLLAVVHARRHRLDRVEGAETRAQALLQRLAARETTPVETRSLEVEAWLALGDAKQALQLARRAARARPGDAACWRDLGLALASAGQPKEAARAFSRSLSLRPSWPVQVALLQLDPLAAPLAGGTPAEAMSALRFFRAERTLAEDRLLESCRETQALRTRGYAAAGLAGGRCQLLLETPERAVETFADLARTRPDDPEPLLWLATARFWSAQPEAAGRTFADALALSERHLAGRPQSPRLRRMRALALAYLGRASEAILDLHEALRALPESAALQLDAARIYALAGDQAAAVAWAQRAVALGAPREWLTGPEFATFREDSDFRALLPR